MDTKSLDSRQVRWAQKLSKYHFRIDYRQGKAKRAATPHLVFLSEIMKKNPTFELKTLKSFIVCSLH